MLHSIEEILARFKKKRSRLVKEEGKPDYHVKEVHDSEIDDWVPLSTVLEHEDFAGHTEESFAAVPDEPTFDGFEGGESGGGGAEGSFDPS